MLDPNKNFTFRSLLIVALLLQQLLVPGSMFAQITTSSLSPADGATGLKKYKVLRIYFNHNWYTSSSPTTKYATIYHAEDDSVFDTSVIPSEVGGSSSNEMYIFNKPAFTTGSYYVLIDGGIIKSSTDQTFFAGISDPTTWNFTVDASGPAVTSLTPTDDSTNVNPTSNLTMTFDENVFEYNGYIYIKKSSDNSTFASFYFAAGSIGTTSSTVSISGNQITLNPSSNMAMNTGYYVTIDTNAIKDANSNYYAGINNTTSWNFTTGNQFLCGYSCSLNFSVADPTFTPLDNATGVSLTSNLTMLFNAEVLQMGSPTATLRIKRSADDSTFETFFMNSARITIENGDYIGDSSRDTRVIVNPTNSFVASTSYYIDIGCDALENADGDQFGINSDATGGKTIWNFTTEAAADTTAPTLSSVSPTDGATGVSVSANLVMNFNEDVQKGSGNIVIKRSSNDSTFATISVDDASVTVSGSQVTINPASDFATSTGYYVNLASGVIEDLAANAYTGIADTSTWNFTTASSGYPILQTSYPPSTDTTYNRSNIRLEFDRAVNLSPGVNVMTCKTGSHSGTTIFTRALNMASTTADSSIIKIPPLPPGVLPGSTIFCQFSGSAIPAQADAGTNPSNFQFEIKLDPAPIMAPGF